MKQSKYPWATLEIGESFVMGGVKPETARGAASSVSKKSGKKFVTARTDEGVRITRTA